MATFAEISDTTLQQQTALFNIADGWANDTLGRMDALAAAAQTQITALNGVTYSPEFDGVSLLYVEPDEAVEPDYSASGPADPVIEVIDAISDFTFNNATYTAQLKATILGVLTNVMGGNVVVANAVWDALWDRVVSDNSRQQVAEEWDASNIGAMLGWTMPSEATASRLDKAQDRSSERISETRLEKAIQEAQQGREDYWNAVTRGNEFEQLWINEHNVNQSRILEAERSRVQSQAIIEELLIKVSDLNVRVYIAKWDGILKEVQAISDHLRARTGKYQAEVQSEQARQGFEALKVDKGLRTEDGELRLAIENARLSVENSLGALAKLAELAAAMAQAAYSASDVSLGTAASVSENLNISQQFTP